jgi:hypothetical protein
MAAANDSVRSIDLVILPELALNSKQLDQLSALMLQQTTPPMVVCGVSLEPANSSGFSRNTCVTLNLAHTPEGSSPTYARTIQDNITDGVSMQDRSNNIDWALV